MTYSHVTDEDREIQREPVPGSKSVDQQVVEQRLAIKLGYYETWGSNPCAKGTLSSGPVGTPIHASFPLSFTCPSHPVFHPQQDTQKHCSHYPRSSTLYLLLLLTHLVFRV